MAAAKDGAVKANEVIKIKEILRKALDAANPSAVAFAVLALLATAWRQAAGAQPATSESQPEEVRTMSLPQKTHRQHQAAIP